MMDRLYVRLPAPTTVLPAPASPFLTARHELHTWHSRLASSPFLLLPIPHLTPPTPLNTCMPARLASLAGPTPLRPPYRRVMMFVDNSGADIVLGMLPFARELLRLGCEVVLVANRCVWGGGGERGGREPGDRGRGGSGEGDRGKGGSGEGDWGEREVGKREGEWGMGNGGGAGPRRGAGVRYQPKLNRTQCNRARMGVGLHFPLFH